MTKIKKKSVGEVGVSAYERTPATLKKRRSKIFNSKQKYYAVHRVREGLNMQTAMTNFKVIEKAALVQVQQKKRKHEVDNEDLYEKFSFLWVKYKGLSSQLIDPNLTWFSQVAIGCQTNKNDIPVALRKKLKEFAEQVYKDEVAVYEQALNMKPLTSSCENLQTGELLFDCVRRCCESPVHSLKYLDKVVERISSEDKEQWSFALHHLKILFREKYFVDGIIVKDFDDYDYMDFVPYFASNKQHLRPFFEKQLVLCLFGDTIRKKYVTVLKALETVLSSEHEEEKGSVILSFSEFLSSHPLQDPGIGIKSIINQIGKNPELDPRFRLVLLSLGVLHPKLITIITSVLIEKLVSTSDKDIVVNKILVTLLLDLIVKSSSRDTATGKLILLVLQCFEIASEKDLVDQQLMVSLEAAITHLAGYLDGELTEPLLDNAISLLEQVVDVSDINIIVQRLKLLYPLENYSVQLSERYYLTMTETLQRFMDSRLLLNHVFRCICKEPIKKNVAAFMRKLFEVATFSLKANCTGGILYLILEGIRSRSSSEQLRIKSLLFVNRYDSHCSRTFNLETESDSDDSSVEAGLEKVMEVESGDLQYYCYDILKTQPWILLYLQRHFDLFVSRTINNLMKGGLMEYRGDILLEKSIHNILDQFVKGELICEHAVDSLAGLEASSEVQNDDDESWHKEVFKVLNKCYVFDNDDDDDSLKSILEGLSDFSKMDLSSNEDYDFWSACSEFNVQETAEREDDNSFWKQICEQDSFLSKFIFPENFQPTDRVAEGTSSVVMEVSKISEVESEITVIEGRVDKYSGSSLGQNNSKCDVRECSSSPTKRVGDDKENQKNASFEDSVTNATVLCYRTNPEEHECKNMQKRMKVRELLESETDMDVDLATQTLQSVKKSKCQTQKTITHNEKSGDSSSQTSISEVEFIPEPQIMANKAEFKRTKTEFGVSKEIYKNVDGTITDNSMMKERNRIESCESEIKIEWTKYKSGKEPGNSDINAKLKKYSQKGNFPRKNTSATICSSGSYTDKFSNNEPGKETKNQSAIFASTLGRHNASGGGSMWSNTEHGINMSGISNINVASCDARKSRLTNSEQLRVTDSATDKHPSEFMSSTPVENIPSFFKERSVSSGILGSFTVYKKRRNRRKVVKL